MAGALSHVRVLDLSRVLAGPTASQVLGDLGAEVIKVERPGGGDDTRSWVPPPLRDANGNDTGESAYYACVNRNKKSVTVDISKPAGQELVKALAAKSDVLIENYLVGALARYGLDYATLSRSLPALVYCSITGFGQTGPYRARPGYDPIMQAMSGLMSVTGMPDGVPGGGPQRTGISVSDLLTGAYSVIGILAALQHRDRTGQGQYIDMALLDVMVASLSNVAMNYLVTGDVPQRFGNEHVSVVPSGAFPCSDGRIQLIAGNDAQFARFCATAGRPELASDPRFASNAERTKNRVALHQIIAGITATRSQQDWTEALAEAGVPCGPINDVAQMFADPHVRARGLRIELDHPLAGKMPALANPIRMSATPPEYRTPPPLLGEHTRAVLGEVLGLADAEIDTLVEAKVI